ncbi:hypothetical protein LCGC14_2028470 [marine sediment metagenome]|uniref:HTH marR-type domain-containing protein n=1 Tax=marine sediment metagenome TaxID=412755 RepID=A0A0F9H8U5_9ZZZZ
MIHQNSREAYHELDLSKRQKIVYCAFIVASRPMTDRLALIALGYPSGGDMNKVRPRITELIAAGLLEEKGKTQDSVTGRTVRLVGLPAEQKEIF